MLVTTTSPTKPKPRPTKVFLALEYEEARRLLIALVDRPSNLTPPQSKWLPRDFVTIGLNNRSLCNTLLEAGVRYETASEATKC